MDTLQDKTNEELHKSLLAEAAKAKNEIQCAKQDLDKASNRLNFVLVLINTLLNRKG